MKTIALLALSLIMQTIAVNAASVLDIPLKDIDGKDTSLNAYKGKVVLIVNVASKCGLTPQYKALEALHEKYKAKGFTVVGFPCNQFLAQELGSESEITRFCRENFGVTFPMFSRLKVNGGKAHPLFRHLKAEKRGFLGTAAIKWNFTKFLVGRDGTVTGRFEPAVKPDSPEVISAIEKALK